MKKGVKTVVNLGLVLASLLLVITLGEAAMRLALPLLPQSVYQYQGRELRILAQTSKESLLPKPGYVALFGDSYAAGQGDWFIENGYDRNSRFQAAHVLHDTLGRDVISFGRPGAGNYDGTAIHAPNSFRFIRDLGLDMPEPADLVIYFYEGNDLEDNLAFYKRHYQPDFDPDRLYDDGYFQGFASEMDARHAQGEPDKFVDRLLFVSLLSRMADSAVQSLGRSMGDVKEEVVSRELNVAALDGGPAPLPDGFRERFMTQNPGELDRALRFFERALAGISSFFKDSRVLVVYVPSPFSCYRTVSGSITPDNGKTVYDVREVWDRSDMICERIRKMSQKNGAGFVDSRPFVRRAAQQGFAHGPLDWGHFNRRGYEALARAVASGLEH